MSARKRIEITKIIASANHLMLHSDDSQREARLGVHHFVSNLLMDAKVYKGFGYLDALDMRESKRGKTVGVIHSPDGKHVFPDDSRTRFY